MIGSWLIHNQGRDSSEDDESATSEERGDKAECMNPGEKGNTSQMKKESGQLDGRLLRYGCRNICCWVHDGDNDDERAIFDLLQTAKKYN